METIDTESTLDYILTCGGKTIRLGQVKPKRAKQQTINGMLKEHFGCNPNLFPIVESTIERYDLPNFARAIDKYLEKDGYAVKLIGVRDGHFDLSDLLQDSDEPRARDYYQGPLEYAHVELPDNQKIQCVSQGLYVLLLGDWRLAALIRKNHGRYKFEIASPSKETSDEFMRGINALKPVVNIYKGRVLLVTDAEFGNMTIKFHELPNLTRDSLILPGGVLERIERNTITFAERSQVLLKAQRHLKRGVLLYGEPGTGKTLTAMYLAKAMPGRTTLLLAGSGMHVLSDACRLARELQPATVILEDVDLIAEDRSRNACNSMLFELLNEMDGLAEDADILFLLTTNRPDVLEAALSQRPGRVDLAVKVPLPDEGCRRRLFELYGAGLDLCITNLDPYIKRTSGANAAFIRELMRRAALLAEEGYDGKLRIEDEHMKLALDELYAKDSGLTKSLLGFGAD